MLSCPWSSSMDNLSRFSFLSIYMSLFLFVSYQVMLLLTNTISNCCYFLLLLCWFFTNTTFVDKIPMKWMLIFYIDVFLHTHQNERNHCCFSWEGWSWRIKLLLPLCSKIYFFSKIFLPYWQYSGRLLHEITILQKQDVFNSTFKK